MLDENIIFSNHETAKEDYASKKLSYPLEECDTPAYDKLIGTLYSEEERKKIEWAIGSIVSGDSKKIQKFMVLYGSAGTGKSRVFKEELKNYFKEYRERYNADDGSRVRSYYIGFKTDKFEEKVATNNNEEPVKLGLIFDCVESLFDREYAECPAQYATADEIPKKKWEKVITKLSDLDTTKLHYVKVPDNHIVIDFDVRDKDGKKDLDASLREASKWPATYGEISKGGGGVHLHYIYTGDVDKLSNKAYREFGSDAYILFGDFKKFYDNIIHEIVKKMLLDLVDDDEFVSWLLDIIFDSFKIDVSYMTDEEYYACLSNVFDKLAYRKTIPKEFLTGEKFMAKSVNIGDQISQIIGIYYPHRIDTYVKFVRSQKYYGRYMDDWYLVCKTKEELIDIYCNICQIVEDLGIHINTKKTRIVKLCSSYKFLQVIYDLKDDGKLYKKLNPDRVVSFRRKLKKLAVKVLEGSSTYENVENTFKSWMGSYYKLLTKIQRKNLIKLYEDLFNKRVNIVQKKMVITEQE